MGLARESSQENAVILSATHFHGQLGFQLCLQLASECFIGYMKIQRLVSKYTASVRCAGREIAQVMLNGAIEEAKEYQQRERLKHVWRGWCHFTSRFLTPETEPGGQPSRFHVPSVISRQFEWKKLGCFEWPPQLSPRLRQPPRKDKHCASWSLMLQVSFLLPRVPLWTIDFETLCSWR